MNDNLVKMLREKTEEADLDTILKTTFGGYSRKSVRDYISMMRQQQYDMQQSFSEELQLSQAERDRLTRELAEANERAAAAEEALENAKPLMEKAAGLEKDMDEAIERIQADAARLEQGEAEARALKQELEQRTAEPAVRKSEAPQAEPFAENPEPRSGTGVIDLAERPETMQIQLAMLTRERENTAKRLESVIRQERSLFQALNECRAELENRRDQNQCMEAENKELSRRLSEQVWQNISLNREITHMRTMNESLKRKLETALEGSVKHNTPNGSQDTGDVFLWNFGD